MVASSYHFGSRDPSSHNAIRDGFFHKSVALIFHLFYIFSRLECRSAIKIIKSELQTSKYRSERSHSYDSTCCLVDFFLGTKRTITGTRSSHVAVAVMAGDAGSGHGGMWRKLWRYAVFAGGKSEQWKVWAPGCLGDLLEMKYYPKGSGL